ncbi:MAG: thiamine-phosphate kinase [Candidatus Methanomethyliaceae archaeon]|nr:thiamine-phosphate kinase [Candidatus Methanomethyliaceae archaeon]MCX8169479.1 thiamine-phosphate kinase [Candidatus Methanomethyliaceae archaeon]MDW7971037.1 thiamine-phosphate kinase [Nitrososphaerota archaeon]
MRVSDLGERKIIDLIWSIMERDGHLLNQIMPPPDDASAIAMDDKYFILKTDMFVKMTDAPKGMKPEHMGSKVVTMNVSDLAAKGARPIALMLSLGLPKRYSIKDLERLIAGISRKAKDYGIKVLGGDVGEAKDLIICGFLLGITKRLIKRSGASPGDVIATTGSFGDTAAAYKILLEGYKAPRKLRKALCEKVYNPIARLDLGIALAESGVVTSSMDSSDGLAFTLNELSKSNNLCFKIFDIPISNEAMEFAHLHSLNPMDLALYGGEEYELILTIKRDEWNRAMEIAKGIGCNLIKIGEVEAGRGVVLIKGNREIVIPSKGWEHLKP